MSRSQCMRERSFLRTLLGTDQVPIYDRTCEFADTVENQEEMQCLLPEIMKRMEGRYPLSSLNDPNFEPGRSFRYDLNDRHDCYIHVRNAKQPASFLECPEHLAENLLYIMDKAEREEACDTLYTATWLNSLPAFLRFFPEEWKMNLSDIKDDDFGSTLGWQGQFINRYGLLNEATASKFLRTGILPYARRGSHCSFESIRRHLKTLRLP